MGVVPKLVSEVRAAKTRKEWDVGDLGNSGSDPSGLASLSITGFRGISQLRIPRMGRVTLLAGKNGVGKTTVLEALRLYAARGQFDTVQEVLIDHEELTTIRGEDEALVSAADLDRLFHRNGGDRTAIQIGPVDGGPALKIEPSARPADVLRGLPQRVYPGDVEVLGVVFGDAPPHHVWLRSAAEGYQPYHRAPNSMKPHTSLRCESLGPGPLDRGAVERLWDQVALTDDETLALDALRLVFGDHVERAAVTGVGDGRHRRRMMVKLADRANPVPLRSLGDGAARMFGVALALANCRDGILLVDEAENGIHYTLHSKFWNMILSTAHANNTQVVATTHSKDCIDGFAVAALQCPDISGNLIRIDRHNGKLHAVEYSMDELETAAEQNIEVR